MRLMMLRSRFAKLRGWGFTDTTVTRLIFLLVSEMIQD